MKRAAFLFSLMLTAPSAANAQESVVTVSPQFSDGVHVGCQLTFDTVLNDHVYDRGRFVQASGSFGLYSFPERGAGFMLKLGIAPLEPRDAPIVAPSTAYLINGYRTNVADIMSTDGAEAPGFTLVIFRGGPETLNALAGLSYGGLQIGYTREDGSAAQQFSVPLNDNQAADFVRCQEALLADEN